MRCADVLNRNVIYILPTSSHLCEIKSFNSVIVISGKRENERNDEGRVCVNERIADTRRNLVVEIRALIVFQQCACACACVRCNTVMYLCIHQSMY